MQFVMSHLRSAFPPVFPILYEKLRIFAIRISQLQFLFVIKISRVIEIQCASRTFLLAAAAFDTDTVHHSRRLRFYGAHRADLDASTTSVAFVCMELRFHFQDVDMIAFAVAGFVVRTDGIASLYIHRARRFKSRLDLIVITAGFIYYAQ